MTKMKITQERFWKKVDKSAGPDACWLWTAHTDLEGYGRFQLGGRNQKAHRLALEWAKGPCPAGKEACHAPKEICGHRHCVNPAHLRWSTHVGNMVDRKKDGTEADNRGVRNGRSKLTATHALEIKALVAGGELQRVVAAHYGVTQVQVSSIVRGRAWKHLPEAAL